MKLLSTSLYGSGNGSRVELKMMDYNSGDNSVNRGSVQGSTSNGISPLSYREAREILIRRYPDLVSMNPGDKIVDLDIDFGQFYSDVIEYIESPFMPDVCGPDVSIAEFVSTFRRSAPMPCCQANSFGQHLDRLCAGLCSDVDADFPDRIVSESRPELPSSIGFEALASTLFKDILV